MKDFKKKFGLRLKELRAERNITQDKLAELLQVSLDTVKNYEAGRYGPEFARLPDLAKALKVKVKDLFDFQ